MAKRRKITVAVLLCAATVALILSRNDEPRYQGKRLSEWLSRFPESAAALDELAYEEDQTRPAIRAVKAIGTNGLSTLIKWIGYEFRPSKPKQFLISLMEWLPAFLTPKNFRDWEFWNDEQLARARHASVAIQFLGPIAEPAIPDLARLAHSRGTDEVPRRAVDALVGIGPKALPAVLSVVTNANATGRGIAVNAVRAFGTNAAPAVPVLIGCLDDNDLSIAAAAAGTLGELRLEPTVTLGALTNMLNAPNPIRRVYALAAIDEFDTAARPVLPALLKALQDDHALVRWAATNIVMKIAPGILPPLLEYSDDPDQNLRNAIIRLRAGIAEKPGWTWSLCR